MTREEAAKNEIVIIGAGHNGLIAATYLARAGFNVRIIERRKQCGGGAITEEVWPGHFFSTCAHLLHGMPPKLFRDFHLWEQGVDVIPRPEPIVLMEDGSYYGPPTHKSPLNRWGPGQFTDEEVLQEKAYRDFKSRLCQLFAPYRMTSFPSQKAFLQGLGAEDRKLIKQATKQSVHTIQDAFMNSERVREGYALDGMAVARDPVGLSLAYDSLTKPYPGEGAPPHGFVKGGMGMLCRALEKEARAAGVHIHLGESVDKILLESGKVVGVRLAEGDEIRCSRVVSNLDPKQTFLKLLEPDQVDSGLRKRISQLKTDISCLKLLAVVSEPPDWKIWDGDPARAHTGSIFLNANRESLAACYDDIEAGRPPRSPAMSVNLPSFKDRSLAEGNNQTASVWAFPAGYELDGQSWDDCKEAVAENLIDQITAKAPNFRDSIVEYKLRTPLDIERDNGMTEGCIWHVQHNAESMFWNRPLPELNNYRSPIPGLYLCGCGQHPGGEVTGLPGHNAAHALLYQL